MATSIVPPNFYLSMIEFLLNSKQRIIAVSSEFGLTAMQAFTLLLTNNETPRSMNTFCRMYDCDASNLTGIVDGLEQKGLVVRREHPKDRRIKLIHLQPAGRKLQQQIVRKLTSQSENLFMPLSQDEIYQFVRLIEKLTSNRMQPTG